MKLLRKCMEIWKNQAELHDGNDGFDVEIAESRVNNKLESYMNLIEAYGTYQKVVEGMVLLHIAESSIQALINIGLAIFLRLNVISAQNLKVIIFMFMTLAWWLLKNLLLEMALGVESEKFYMANEQAVTSYAIRMRLNSGIDKRICKKICRLNRSSVPKLTIYGLFDLDSSLPFKLINFIATYTIVILQFALL